MIAAYKKVSDRLKARTEPPSHQARIHDAAGDAEFLLDLAKRLRSVPVFNGVDGHDIDRLQVLAGRLIEAPPHKTLEQPWQPWIDMPVGDQRYIVREVRSAAGETALAYWTGSFMAYAPVSDDPVELPFKVWGQRPPPQQTPELGDE